MSQRNEVRTCTVIREIGEAVHNNTRMQGSEPRKRARE